MSLYVEVKLIPSQAKVRKIAVNVFAKGSEKKGW